jgi:hypothetical protein
MRIRWFDLILEVSELPVFSIIGGFSIKAAFNSDPQQSHGLSGAIRALVQLPHGGWILGIVSAGLIAYGIFMLVAARYGEFQV